MPSGFTALGKEYMLKNLAEAQVGIKVMNSDGEEQAASVFTNTFRDNGRYDDPIGAYTNDQSLNFEIGSNEDVEYVCLYNADFIHKPEFFIHKLGAPIDFPDGGTYTINNQKWELNGGGNHTPLTPFE